MLLVLLSLALADEGPDSMECTLSPTAIKLQEIAGRASVSFLSADAAGYELARDQAFSSLPCVTEALQPATVSAMYQLVALDGVYTSDVARRDAGLNALAATNPDYKLPSVFSDTHPVRKAWNAAAANDARETTSLPVPLNAFLLIDGEVTLDYPVDRPAVVQFFDRKGALMWTRMTDAGEQLPQYEATDESKRSSYLEKRFVRERRPIELLVASGIALAAGAGMYGGTYATRKNFDDCTNSDDCASSRSTTNALTIGAASSTVLGLGFGAVAVVNW